jgi:hypothetical protein
MNILCKESLNLSEEDVMKAAVLFTGTGPILIVTSFDSLSNPKFLEQIKSRGINKFIAYEVSLEVTKQKYGGHYNLVIEDLRPTDDIRVMDVNGHCVFYNYKFKDLKEPFTYEPD